MRKKYKLIVGQKQIEAIITGLDKYGDDLADSLRTYDDEALRLDPHLKQYRDSDRETFEVVSNLLDRVKKIRFQQEGVNV